jgi:hypothetical protein
MGAKKEQIHDVLCVWHSESGYFDHEEECNKCLIAKQARKQEGVKVIKEMKNIIAKSSLYTENHYDCSNMVLELLDEILASYSEKKTY